MSNPRLDELEIQLGENQWLGGQKLSAADAQAFDEIKDTPPNPELQPNLFAWYALVSKFTDTIRASWTGDAVNPAPAKRATTKKAEEKKPAEEEEFDPFAEGGDDDDGDLAEFEARMAEKAAAAKKNKKAVIAKSLVIWDVKGWDDTTDWAALAEKILTEVTMDGLVWKTEWKLEPIAFGLKKLQIGAVIEDDKVSTDLVAEKITEYEDYVQSVDIAVFNKL